MRSALQPHPIPAPPILVSARLFPFPGPLDPRWTLFAGGGDTMSQVLGPDFLRTTLMGDGDTVSGASWETVSQ